ncbi:MAG: DUF6933 domain-containing protein [Acidimicrobiia bacterium]
MTGCDQSFLEQELQGMTDHVLDKTRNRSVVGVMNEFASLRRVSPRQQGRCPPASHSGPIGRYAVRPALQDPHHPGPGPGGGGRVDEDLLRQRKRRGGVET